ncbi:MAG: hypothetical protein EBU88_07295 [Acidobacteria bacterium]|nr:hypothetical protein [Acidobacteriota bacterium]
MKTFSTALFAVTLILVTISLSIEGCAQEVFEDPEGKYTVSLPTGWLGIVNRDALGRSEVNIVYKVRENGSLKVRRIEGAAQDGEVVEHANKDEADRIRFTPGYTRLRMEKFLISPGKYGALLSYDYQTISAQPFTGRVYYLRTDDQTLYVLQFTGRRNILGSLRNQTDLIARSFRSK